MVRRRGIGAGAIGFVMAALFVACSDDVGAPPAVTVDPVLDGAPVEASEADEGADVETDAGADASTDALMDVVDAADASCCPLEGRRFHDDGDAGCLEPEPRAVACKPATAEDDGATYCIYRPQPVCIVSSSDPSSVYYLTDDGPDPHVAGFERCSGPLTAQVAQAPVRAGCGAR